MNPGSLARRYGRAFFLVVEEAGKIDLLGGEIEKAALFFQKNHEVIKTLADNFYPLSERKQLFSQFADHLSLSIETRNFLNLLLDKNRISFFPEIAFEFGRLLDEVRGIVRIEVASAAPLSRDFLKRAGQFLSQKTGKKPVIVEKINPDLVGGVVLREGGVLYDGSVRSEIRKLKEQLIGMV
ncbi:MAG: ATP synthase F1 subunit delta [Deltaproteobacteria bacterium]|nr:ATP synthase F1 subunit delta [Deltaproteobacteria bacterium]